jgi:SH3-like domain-containing protein
MIKKTTIWFLFLIVLFIQLVKADEKFWSLKNDKVNVRYSHGKEHAIKYIYKKINLPVKQIDKKDNWRRIVDLKNNSGWIHDSQLKKSNSLIILENKILFKKPTNFSKPIARLEKGRLLIIKKCEKNWCNITTESYSGWIKTNNVWGKIN